MQCGQFAMKVQHSEKRTRNFRVNRLELKSIDIDADCSSFCGDECGMIEQFAQEVQLLIKSRWLMIGIHCLSNSNR